MTLRSPADDEKLTREHPPIPCGRDECKGMMEFCLPPEEMLDDQPDVYRCTICHRSTQIWG
jgi:hypothetical protein